MADQKKCIFCGGDKTTGHWWKCCPRHTPEQEPDVACESCVMKAHYNDVCTEDFGGIKIGDPVSLLVSNAYNLGFRNGCAQGAAGHDDIVTGLETEIERLNNNLKTSDIYKQGYRRGKSEIDSEHELLVTNLTNKISRLEEIISDLKTKYWEEICDG